MYCNIHTYVLPLPIFFSHEHSKAAKFQKQFYFPTIFTKSTRNCFYSLEISTIVKMEEKLKFLLKFSYVLSNIHEQEKN